MASQPPEILTSVLSHILDPETPAPSDRPWVTLTYAQSLDARIAGVGGKQLILSGKESMLMTHWMRTMHDGIMVGIGTALNDNPQLNTRHVPNSTAHPTPQPIILDSQCRLSPDRKLLANHAAGTGKQPWVLCSSEAKATSRCADLEAAGALVADVPGGPFDVLAVLRHLREQGVKSLMVEGGRSVISSFFAARDSQGRPVVDRLIVTVAPILVGSDGVGVALEGATTILRLEHLCSQLMGRDTVVACRVELDSPESPGQ
ncbi:bacterial bifunctional deaminase-reductase [Auricularia subglabra TFB-10046 SS5]|nr:bacterial bifunctional deaminase-reductase [Auricularia subglabra TFB-10046 SS5]